MRGLLAGLSLMLALPPFPAAALTAEEARDLPLPDLARVVLGDLGATIVRIDRPAWPRCGGMCPIPTPEEAERTKRGDPAPPRYGMAFYQRPEAIDTADDWSGACLSIVINVDFDDTGHVKAFRSSTVYGFVDEDARVPVAPVSKGPGVFLAVREQRNRACATRWSIARHFHADSLTTAAHVAMAARQLALHGANSQGGTITVSCSFLWSQNNRCTPEQIAELASPFTFGYAREAPCPVRPRPARRGVRLCYDVSLDRDGESLFIETTPEAGGIRLTGASYTQARVVY